MGISFCRGPVEEPGVYLLGILREIVNEGSAKGASLSAGALLGEPGGGTPLLGTLEVM
jgi:hypothetical protein